MGSRTPSKSGWAEKRRALLASLDGPVCALCGHRFARYQDGRPVRTRQRGRLQPTVDHFVPVSHGGDHGVHNTVLAHQVCNEERGDRVIPVHALFGPARQRIWENNPYVQHSAVPTLRGPNTALPAPAHGPARRLAPDDPIVTRAARCPACTLRYAPGTRVVDIPLGPGGSADARQVAAAGGPHQTVAVVVHERCVTGRTPEEE